MWPLRALLTTYLSNCSHTLLCSQCLLSQEVLLIDLLEKPQARVVSLGSYPTGLLTMALKSHPTSPLLHPFSASLLEESVEGMFLHPKWKHSIWWVKVALIDLETLILNSSASLENASYESLLDTLGNPPDYNLESP